MSTKTRLLYVGFRALSACCVCAAFLMITSCGDNVMNPDSPEPDGEGMIPVAVSRVENGTHMESHIDAPNTTGRRTPVDGWVPMKEPSTGRAIPAAVPYEGPSAIRITLCEEPQATTRVSTLGNGIYFRLIAFRKVDSNYVFQSAADFTTNGASAPTPKQGNLLTRAGAVRVIGYSFNSTAVMGMVPSSYAYNSTSVTVSNMSSDFMVYDPGDITNVSTISHNLSVSFTQKLCKLTVKFSLSQFVSNTFTDYTDVYVSLGGSTSAWTVGPSTNNVDANTGNTSTFSIANNSIVTIRLASFSGPRAITVYIGMLKLSNYFSASNRNITSSQNMQLLPGRSYTTALKFELGIQLAVSDITLTQNGCTTNDRNNLAKLRWATGNLKSTGSANYVWTTAADYGYYYTFYSTYTGDTNTNNIDPCSKLNTAYYGTGWHTPGKSTLIMLSRCTNKVLVNEGMWFMNSSTGLFLPVAGYRNDNQGGSDTKATSSSGTQGLYQNRDDAGGTLSYFILFGNGTIDVGAFRKKDGKTVRCAKED